MNENLITIPLGGSETILKRNGEIDGQKIKVNKMLLDNIPSKNQPIQIYFEGSGFNCNGEIYHKSNTHIYIYLY